MGSHISMPIAQLWSYTMSHINAMSQTWSYKKPHIDANAISQIWSYMGSHNPNVMTFVS
ncbi:putative ATP-dependent helicase UL5 [Gossypium arboreum]|uniref:Putative ATP-dependent helicase UL5 n=1 Tax=Gossypium arboreum TaxID=29729 RepID=A0A0B0NRK1_GOSAR|nr:putative ATP-dependent helicase UL5 [Gossypium arboreum]